MLRGGRLTSHEMTCSDEVNVNLVKLPHPAIVVNEGFGSGSFFQTYKYMCQGLNSHYFHIIGDGHQPNDRLAA